ncbi:MAG: peptide-methionine (S)-S-oxide reductase [Planctomycetes bacterium]|nr:peptide-methionine (S)-S-oxide reductase [Planctomycetota bacterium]|tara:strand:- start:20 stop:682 length:663 start_codon:yes stop_codon:yes gene_type:complete
MYLLSLAVLAASLTACSDRVNPSLDGKTMKKTELPESSEKETTQARESSSRETATLGAGCFWCIEAVLEQIEGISDVTSGYMGGTIENPTYEQICTGLTGHAEVVQVTFDPKIIDFSAVLEHFWTLHDPTTLNRQGNDVGTQYRSAIFFHSEKQRAIAEKSKKEKNEKGVFHSPIVTEIAGLEKFYPAEEYHQDYYRNNKAAPYCQFVITPKLDKLGLEK